MKTTTNTPKIFITVIALLLIANVVTLTMLFMGKKPEQDDRRNAMRNYLKTDVGFTEIQLKQYDSIKTLHKLEAKTYFDSLRESKQANLKIIGAAGFNDTVLQKAANKAAVTQQTVELNMLQHLKSIRNLCTAAQLIVFDTSFYKVMAKPSLPNTKN